MCSVIKQTRLTVSYGFDVNMVSRSGSHVVPVFVPDGDEAIQPGSLDCFEAAWRRCESEGLRVKAVVRVPVPIVPTPRVYVELTACLQPPQSFGQNLPPGDPPGICHICSEARLAFDIGRDLRLERVR